MTDGGEQRADADAGGAARSNKDEVESCFDLSKAESAFRKVNRESEFRDFFSETPRQWEDGLYAIQYFRRFDLVDAEGGALAIVREGHILGSDKFGGVFEGRIIEGGLGGADRVVLKLRVPPGGCLVTGLCVGDEGAVVDVRGALKRQGFCWGGTFEVAGEWVEIRFHFVGPLPRRAAP